MRLNSRSGWQGRRATGYRPRRHPRRCRQHGLHAVVEDLFGHAAEIDKCVDMAAKHGRQLLVLAEPAPEKTAVAEHHRKKPDHLPGAGRVGELDLEIGKVDLSLLARLGLVATLTWAGFLYLAVVLDARWRRAPFGFGAERQALASSHIRRRWLCRQQTRASARQSRPIDARDRQTVRHRQGLRAATETLSR